jgi:hypothetical protein
MNVSMPPVKRILEGYYSCQITFALPCHSKRLIDLHTDIKSLYALWNFTLLQ